MGADPFQEGSRACHQRMSAGAEMEVVVKGLDAGRQINQASEKNSAS